MTKLTEKQIRFIAENLEDLTEHAELIAKQYLDAKGIYYNYIKDDISFDENFVSFRIETSRCGCCSDTDYDSFPIEYLWEKESLEKMKEDLRKEKEKEEKAKKEKEKREERKRKKEKEENDRKQYEELKKKFE